jgi:energy-coupling factor transporter ATP-binding protein EcfA2
MKLVPQKFRVLNFRNIDDSGWIPVELVTAFVGRNESGKTALLKALHKFNPAAKEPYEPQREFPRDRFTSEFRGTGKDFPVCEVEFALSQAFRAELTPLFQEGEPPTRASCTRYYDGSLKISYDAPVTDDPVGTQELVRVLNEFAKAARRLPAPSAEKEDETQALRMKLVEWSDGKKDAAGKLEGLKSPAGTQLLQQVRSEANARSSPQTADLVEALVGKVDALLARAQTPPLPGRLDATIEKAMPVFIYFENYGILDSAVYLPRLLDDLKREPSSPRVKTINAMFKHVGLTAAELAELGKEQAVVQRQQGQEPTAETIRGDQQRKELRSIKLNSASNAITNQFNEWYQADGDYFRIWVSDDRRPNIEIELESRSKGFQWFFSFYLVFLVESEEGHREAILLLDEPGMHLHPTAQQELIAFFERLAGKNPLIYTTHSPFLVDGDHIHRVRPVKEDATGHSQVSVDTWPEDRETIFPLQAAAGYAMVRGLFQHKKNVLVEGFSDYLYLHSLALHCRALGRTALPDDVYVTPCGGTKHVGYLASLFLGQKVRPVVLLDSDQAGRERQTALLKELYSGHEKAVLMLAEVLGLQECAMEDLIGEAVLLPVVREVLGHVLSITAADRAAGALVDQIKTSAARQGVTLPDGWKPEVARRIVVAWTTTDPAAMPEDVLDRAENLFHALNERFEPSRTTGISDRTSAGVASLSRP